MASSSTADYKLYDSTHDDGARNKILAACIAVFLVQYSQSQAMIAPFFSASVPGAILGPDMVGIVFSAYPLATACATPLPSYVIRFYGVGGMVVLGLSLTAVANLVFGIAGAWATDYLSGSLGIVLILARALGGVGAALSEAGCLTAVSTAGWGDDLGKALSAVEVTTGTGAAIGAALSGWLYPLGGFFLPMVVGAVLPLLVVPIAYAFLPRDGRDPDSPSEAVDGGEQLLSGEASVASGWADYNRSSWARRVSRYSTCVSLFLAASVFEGLNPLLEPHLKQRPYHFDVTMVGMLLATICIVYTITALPIGWLTDRSNKGRGAGCRLRGLMVSGWVATLIAAALLTPGGGGSASHAHPHGEDSGSLWPIAEAPAQIALAVATPLLGAGAALVIIPSLPDMQRGLGHAGRDDQRRAALCALWNGAYAGGSAVGPLVSTMLYARAGWSSIVIAQAVVSIGTAMMLLGTAILPS